MHKHNVRVVLYQASPPNGQQKKHCRVAAAARQAMIPQRPQQGSSNHNSGRPQCSAHFSSWSWIPAPQSLPTSTGPRRAGSCLSKTCSPPNVAATAMNRMTERTGSRSVLAATPRARSWMLRPIGKTPTPGKRQNGDVILPERHEAFGSVHNSVVSTCCSGSCPSA